jgi:DNA-binding SARP family transcriptional activator
MTTAELMLAISRDELRRAERIGDQLMELGARDEMARTSQQAAVLMCWAYMHAVRIDDVRAVLAAAEEGPGLDAVKYAVRVMMDVPGQGPPVAPSPTGGLPDAMVSIADYTLGRLSALSAPAESPLVEMVTLPWRIAALRTMGKTERALALYEAVAEAPRGALMLETLVGPQLLVDAGRAAEARALLTRGQRHAESSGSIALQGLAAYVDAKIALRVDRDTAAARQALDRAERLPRLREFRFLSEVIDTYYGLALLFDGEDALALVRLQRGVEGMVAGHRILELPTAGVYLAEAQWRAGDEDAADRAADLSLDAARRQGANHVLLQALGDMPAVLSRRLDAEPGAESEWHDVGRALIAQGARPDVNLRHTVQLQEFGRCVLVVDGVEVKPRIRKIYELLAYLIVNREHSVGRDELIEVLFDGRLDDSTRAYLRQTLHLLRQLLPGVDVFAAADGGQKLHEGLAVTSESSRLESRLAQASRLQGSERLTATLAAIEPTDRGEYLPCARSGWADDRRSRLAELTSNARFEAAELAHVAGRLDLARSLNEHVLAGDRHREAAWRLQMRLEGALGDDDGVIRAFHECERALGELGTTPSETTRRLLDQLRR